MNAIPPSLHYLALGDSYTIGEAVSPDRRWPAVLVQRLRAAGVSIDEPQIVAVTGWTTDELAQGMDAATLTPPYDLVTIQIGVNNQYRGRPADDYREQFAGLLARAIGLAGGHASHVVAVSIPDWGVTRFAREHGRDRNRNRNRNRAQITAELDIYNTIARAEVDHASASFVDITGISRQHPDLLADDGLHPSAAQYALWAAAIEPTVQSALHGY